MKYRQPLIEQLILTPMDHGSYTFTCINTISVTFWVKIYGHELYPFHLVSDFGTELVLEPKMAFVNEIITKKAKLGPVNYSFFSKETPPKVKSVR